MRFAMIATGYVGLISSACFADSQARYVDKDEDEIKGPEPSP